MNKFIASSACFGLLVFMARGEQPSPGDNAKEIFTWFDSLGFPDLAKCKFVRVATGQFFRPDGKAPQNRYYWAFLVKDEGSRFTVFTMGLELHTYTKTNRGKAEHQRIGYEPANLTKVMNRLLKQNQQAEDEDWFPGQFGGRLSDAGQLFVCARACAAQGHPKLAKELLTQSKRSESRRRPDDPKPFPQVLVNGIAHAKMWLAVEAFGDPDIPRTELLARFTWIAKHFPRSSYAERARQTADLLRKMVAEDQAHDRRKPKPLKTMTEQERVAELIFRLRDQNGQQWSQPGSCNIFIHDRFGDKRAEKSPAQQLVDIGYHAVPQLIEVIEDERFTRSVGFHRDFYFSHYVLRVGDCAVTILEHIAGQRFATGTAPLKEGQARAAKAAVQAWWRKFQKKGEKKVLNEGTAAGDENCLGQAERLVQKYPESALGAIRQGVMRTKEEWTRAALVALAATLKGDQPVAFLRQELRGPVSVARVAAARGLLDRGQEEAVPAMVREWRRRGSEGVRSDLVEFLLWCGKEEAVRALADGLRARPIDVRVRLIEVAEMVDPEWRKRQKSFSAAVTKAIDGLLVDSLDDTEEQVRMSGSWGGKEYADPRICDLSGHVLASRWKQPGWFDLSGSLRTRDRQRVALKNRWRGQQGMRPLPLPEPRKIQRLPASRVRPLLDRLESAKDRHDAEKTLLALGLPALPAVRERLRTTKPNQPGYPPLNELAARMACIVGEVRFSDRSAPPSSKFRRQVSQLKGRPLTPDMVVALLRIVKELPSGVTGIKLAIEREGDDTGVVIDITLTTNNVGEQGGERQWDTHETISVGGKLFYHGFGVSSLEHGKTKEQWQFLANHVEKALATPPGTNVSVRVGIVGK